MDLRCRRFWLLPGLFAFVLAALNSSAASDPLSEWTRRTPPSWIELEATTWANERYVAVGFDGRIVSSPDESHWALQQEGDPAVLTGVAGGNGTFVVVGWQPEPSPGLAVVYTSNAGGPWSRQNAANLAPLKSIAFGNGRFVACASAAIYSSVDGKEWRIEQQYPTTVIFEKLRWSDGRYLACGTRQSFAQDDSTVLLDAKVFLAASADGVSWTNLEGPTSGWANDVTANQGVFVTVLSNRVLRSPDGVTWSVAWDQASDSSQDAALDLRAVAHGNGMFVAVGRNGLLRSGDGQSWTVIRRPGLSTLTDIIFHNGLFTTVGESGAILTSADGETWTAQQPFSADVGRAGVAYGRGMFVATDGDYVLVSSNGAAWDRRPVVPQAGLERVIFDGASFVALGDGIYRSTDAATWEKVAGITGRSLAYGRGLYVCVGQEILVSSNLVDWTHLSSEAGAGSLNDVAYGLGAFVAVGLTWTGLSLSAFITSSTDGVHWVAQKPPFSQLNAVAYGNGTFAAAGGQAGAREIFISQDGIDWTLAKRSSGREFTSVGYGGGWFVATGFGDTLAVSNDPAAWTNIPASLPYPSSFAFGRGTFVAAAPRATIRQSGAPGPVTDQRLAFQSARVLGDGTRVLELEAPIDARLSLEASPNLTSWSPVRDLTNWTTTAEVRVTPEPAPTFYRVRRLP